MRLDAQSILPPALRALATVLRLPKGTVLFAQGSRPKAMYGVLSGEVRLVRIAANGAEIVLQRATSGFVAEASLDHAAYHCDAVVVRSATILSVPRSQFQRALADTAFREGWIGYVNAQLRHSRLQCERLLLRTARERVLHFMETEARGRVLKLDMTKKAWAAELGLTHEALYRTLRAMFEAGELIERPPGCFRTKETRPRAASL